MLSSDNNVKISLWRKGSQFAEKRKGTMKKLISTGLSFLTVLLFFTPSAFAWGPQAHQAIGWIADQHLTPEIKKTLTNRYNIRRLESVAKWADTVRKKKRQGPWHYVNIAEGQLFYAKDRDCKTGECVVEKIIDFTQVLKNNTASNEKKTIAIKYLAHLVGDAHQPLHAGNRNDRGGNSIPILFLGDKTNLHALWDSGLLQGGYGKMPGYAERLNLGITPQSIEEWENLSPEIWINESRLFAIEHVYKLTDPMGKEYIRRGREIVDLRIRQAGIRLALLLNQALK
jgi:nuclease S1